jgi:GrpB-like predicted nucleotidyltransferase (UPF0157 family)
VIGLPSGVVRLACEYEACAVEFAAAHAALIVSSARPLAVEHIGSSSVRGLVSKPIVDIVFGLTPEWPLDATISLLRSLGYRYRGNREDAGGHIADYVVGTLTTRHVHIVDRNQRQWLRYISFREYLRADIEARHAYANFKLQLAREYSNSRRSYTSAKAAFVEQMTDHACAWHASERS